MGGIVIKKFWSVICPLWLEFVWIPCWVTFGGSRFNRCFKNSPMFFRVSRGQSCLTSGTRNPKKLTVRWLFVVLDVSPEQKIRPSILRTWVTADCWRPAWLPTDCTLAVCCSERFGGTKNATVHTSGVNHADRLAIGVIPRPCDRLSLGFQS